MNLIDFHVTEIISEERDKVWKPYGMSKKELEKEKEDENNIRNFLGNIQVFCGWDAFGQIIIKEKEDRHLTYRMNRTLANRQLSKIENFTGKKCMINKVI